MSRALFVMWGKKKNGVAENMNIITENEPCSVCNKSPMYLIPQDWGALRRITCPNCGKVGPWSEGFPEDKEFDTPKHNQAVARWNDLMICERLPNYIRRPA